MPEKPKDIASDLKHFLETDRIERLTRALKDSAHFVKPAEARFIVDAYYQVQEVRKATRNQLRSSPDETNLILEWLCANVSGIEDKIVVLLNGFAQAHAVGRWSQSIHGIGPVISAGLIAHIDIERAKTVGHIWRFAGLDPTVEWMSREQAKTWLKDNGVTKFGDDEVVDLVSQKLGRRIQVIGKEGEPQKPTKDNVAAAIARRPWNAKLKVLCWKIGESFARVSTSDKDFYGHLYQQRKAYEVAKNAAGDYADQAAATLARAPGHAQRAIYAEGKLPDGRIDMRARRWAAKLFLAHWHHVAYESRYGEPPPKPYVIEHMGHTDIIQVPNWPMEDPDLQKAS